MKKQTIGQRLREKRLEKNLSLEDVHRATRIHPRVLLALEEDRAEKNLSRFYIKNFLNDYAKFLELDAGEIVKEYLDSHKFLSEPITQAIKNLNLFLLIKKLKPRTVLILASVVILWVISSVLTNKEKISFRKINELSNKEEFSQTGKDKGFPEIQKKEPLHLMLKTKKEVWMQVKADKEIVFQDTLEKEAVKRWTADNSIELWVGDGNALELELNGQYLGSPGTGVIKNIIITRQGMEIGNKN